MMFKVTPINQDKNYFFFLQLLFVDHAIFYDDQTKNQTKSIKWKLKMRTLIQITKW